MYKHNLLSMKVYSVFLIFLFFAFSVSDVFGQRWRLDRHHLTLGLGASGFMGDLGGADKPSSLGISDFDFAAVKPSVMLGYRYHLMEDVTARANIVYGQVSGSDANTNEPYRNNRNIHFRSPILEVSVQGEYFFFSAERVGARYRRVTRGFGWLGYNISAYAFAGIGGFYFNPQAKFDRDLYMELGHSTVKNPDDLPENGWYELRPLNTEGQGYYPTRDKYRQIQIAVPIGVGAIFHINRDLSVGFEYGFRKTWTDYIDDVSTTYVDPSIYSQMFNDPQEIALAEYFSNPTNNSLSQNATAPGMQRGGPTSNDSYMFAFVTVFYKIPEFRPGSGIPRF